MTLFRPDSWPIVVDCVKETRIVGRLDFLVWMEHLLCPLYRTFGMLWMELLVCCSYRTIVHNVWYAPCILAFFPTLYVVLAVSVQQLNSNWVKLLKDYNSLLTSF